MTTTCMICGNAENNEVFPIKELQLGLLETFHYQLCKNCGSMQLLDPPTDFSRYYPNEDYYSFNMEMKKPGKPGLLRSWKSSYLLYGKNKLTGSILSIGYKVPEHYDWMTITKTQAADAILDVGCGNGSLLTKLFKMGFTNLTGIDPFINKGYDYGEVKIQKKEIFDVDSSFDLIMMHHSLEHMVEPQKALQKAFFLLKKNKYLLVRVPVMGNFGWQRYKDFWCGIDAPRHIFIPSEKAMHKLAEDAGFIVDKTIYDSSDYVVWSSEQYLKGIPLHAPESKMINRKTKLFSKQQIKHFKKEIAEANARNFGDTAAFYLRKSS